MFDMPRNHYLFCINLILVLSILPIADAKSVIITVDEFYDEALTLASINSNSEVVNVSFIDSNYVEAEDNSFVGFSDQNIEGASEIKNYDYSLAKKIINFLRNNSYETITLFGDAALIPPSYYFYNDIGQDLYDKWIPTDFFYTSTDYDLNSESSIGRIPVTTKEEANNFINKLLNWEEEDNVVVAAGKISDSELYKGELAAIDTINKGLFGTSSNKYFESDKKFRKNELLTYFTNKDAGIVYIIGHGNGDRIIFEDGIISANDILKNEYKQNTPVIISVLCDNGAYDTRLTGRTYRKSFGEAIISSKAGGIAYLGASRYSYGLPGVETLNGIVKTIKKEYITELVDYIIASDEENIGNKVKEGLNVFVTNKDMSDKYNLRTLFELTLLGDPNLKMKKRENLQINQPIITIEKNENTTIIKSSENANMKVLDLNTKTLIASQENGRELSFTFSDKSVYLIKVDNGKETRAYIGLKEETMETTLIKKVYVEEPTGEIHDVQIKTAQLTNNNLECNRNATLNLKITNEGQRNENLNIEIMNTKLGITIIKDIGIDQADEYKASYLLQFPNAKQGEYEIEINVYNFARTFDNKKIKLTIQDCLINQSKTEERAIIKEEIVEIPQQNAIEKEEISVWQIILTVIIVGATTFLVMFLIMKPKKWTIFS